MEMEIYIEIRGKKYKESPFYHHFPKLNIGDNHVKVYAYDKRGNRSEHTINIAIKRVENNGINIDNNIEIYNY